MMWGKIDKAGPTISTTLIAAGTQIQGDIRFTGELYIEGTVVGNVCAEKGTKSIVRVMESGAVIGELDAPSLVINGKVDGDVYSADHVELAEQAEVHGDVHYKSIEMLKGAHLNGNLVFLEEKMNEPVPLTPKIDQTGA